MKKTFSLAVGSIAILVFAAALVFSMNVALAAGSITVGNPAISRATTDTFTNFTIIDTNNPVSANGTLDTFTYYAANTNPFEFVIVDAGNVVKYISPTITPASTGLHTFTAVGGVPVLAGWNLGVHFDSTGTIPFSGGGSLATYTANNSGMPTVGVALVPAGTSPRTYSWNASAGLIVDDDLACPGAAYTTIQAAVNAANSGDTITVCAGTYAEHVNIPISLNLFGPNYGVAGNAVRNPEAIVDGTGTDAPFAINANNVTMRGFKIVGGANGGLFSGIWIVNGSTGWIIEDNIIFDNAIGVYARCGSNCTLEHNLFDSNNRTGPSGGAAIYGDSSNGLTVNANEFKGHTLNNPVQLFTSNTNLSFTNNSMHDNVYSNVYGLSLTNATFSGNTITPASDSTGIALGGGDSNIQITGNTITSGARGVRIEDDGYGLGGNSAITINRNSLANDSNYGVGNISGYTGNVNATCNWWGAANGPGPVGTGSGSPVTSNVDFSTWLTTSDLTGPCNGVPAPNVTVTIHKYVDGVHADNTNAEGLSFPMASCWNATNIGASCGSFSLAPTTYDAQTSSMSSGADYSTNEETTGPSVGASCADGKPFALVGYSTGDTEAQAAAAPVSTTSPALTNITTDKHVIVWNKDCTPATLTIVKKTVNGNGTFSFTITNGPSTPSVPNITTVGGSGTSSPINLESGTYNVNELSQSGWTLSDSDCVYGNQSVGQQIAGGEQITVDAGDSVTCTFTNTNTSTVHVTIIKYVNEVHATAANAATSTFPMQATYTFSNAQFPNGISGSDPYDIGPTGNNTPNAYEAQTLEFYQGASYSTFEHTNTPVVGASCADGKPFALNGYSSGDSLAAAQSAATTTQAPAFTGMTTNKFVIVHNKKCVAPPAPEVTVTIVKFLNGQHATAGNAGSTAFPMASCWTTTNFPSGCGTYTLSPVGFNSPNAYEAITSSMNSGSSYSTNEVLTGPSVGASCADGKPYALQGYSTGSTLAQASSSVVSGSTPAFTNITSNKYIIVWDVSCVAPPAPPPPANACDTPTQAPAGYTLRNGTTGNDNVTLAPNTMFVGKGGNDRVTAGDGNYIICTGAGNDSIQVGNGNWTIDAGGGNNSVLTGNGNGTITTGSGNDSVTTGNGTHTISTGAGNDSIMTGSGADTINAGNGHNSVSSGAGNDNVSSGSGNDSINGGADTDTCTPGGGVNTVSNCELP